MNILKEEKPLIEWEKELDVWLVDICLADHFVSYNKMDAFDKINIFCFKRGWSNKENEIYSEYLSNKYSDCLVLEEFKNKTYHTYYDLYEQKPLIEWELERGIWIPDLCYSDHLRIYYKKDAFDMLRKPTVMWNNESQQMYNNYKNTFNSIGNGVINNSENDVKRNVKVVNKKKSKNKVSLKKNILKRSIALLMGITASLSGYFYCKENIMEKSNDDFINNSYVVSSCNRSIIDDDSCESLFLGGLNPKDKIEDEKVNEVNDKIYDSKSGLKSSLLKVEKSIINNKNDIVINSNEKNSNIEISSNEIVNYYYEIGEKVVIDNDSEIYGNCYDAMNNKNGMDPYYSYEYDRTITGICLNYNDCVIYLDNNDEINNYINDGASVVSYSTMVDNGICEGFYCADDIKIMVKQI